MYTTVIRPMHFGRHHLAMPLKTGQQPASKVIHWTNSRQVRVRISMACALHTGLKSTVAYIQRTHHAACERSNWILAYLADAVTQQPAGGTTAPSKGHTTWHTLKCWLAITPETTKKKKVFQCPRRWVSSCFLYRLLQAGFFLYNRVALSDRLPLIHYSTLVTAILQIATRGKKN